jgi:hypothetical protein
MAADIRVKYPATSTTAVTISLASLATSSTWLAGQESTAVENSNDDLDHAVSGVIMVGTTPTANTIIEVWAYSARSISSGTPTYPDVLDGTDSAETITNAGVKYGMLRLVASLPVTATTSNVGHEFPPTSIATLFGYMPQFWGLFVTHNTGVNLNSTAGNHVIHYERVQAQTV